MPWADKEYGKAYMQRWRDTHKVERAAWSRKHYLERREWLRGYQLQRGCADCRTNGDFRVLEFDHVPERGTKEFHPASGYSHSLRRLLEELKKCDVVCANCHNIRTFEREKTDAV